MRKNFYEVTKYLESELCKLRENARISKDGIKNFLNLSHLYAAHGNWKKVENIASEAVLFCQKISDKKEFYTIWIHALFEQGAKSDLVLLLNHLNKVSKKNECFTPLTLIVSSLLGFRKIAERAFNRCSDLKNKNDKFLSEGLAYYYSLCFQNKSISLNFFKNLTKRKVPSYFILRNYLRLFQNENNTHELNFIYSIIKKNYPYAKEPYYANITNNIRLKKWKNVYTDLSKVLEKDPNDSIAILGFSECLERDGEYKKVVQILLSKKNIFTSDTYDYNNMLSRNMYHIYRETKDKFYLKYADYYKKSAEIAIGKHSVAPSTNKKEHRILPSNEFLNLSVELNHLSIPN